MASAAGVGGGKDDMNILFCPFLRAVNGTSEETVVSPGEKGFFQSTQKEREKKFLSFDAFETIFLRWHLVKAPLPFKKELPLLLPEKRAGDDNGSVWSPAAPDALALPFVVVVVVGISFTPPLAAPVIRRGRRAVGRSQLRSLHPDATAGPPPLSATPAMLAPALLWAFGIWYAALTSP